MDPLDFTYTLVPDLIFGALEIELGIVVACLPILRPVARKISGSNYLYSVFGRGRSSGSDTFGNVLDKNKSSAHIGAVGFDHLAVSGVPSSQAAAQAHVYSSHDLKSGGQGCSGDIMVRKDLHVYRTLTDSAGTVI